MSARIVFPLGLASISCVTLLAGCGGKTVSQGLGTTVGEVLRISPIGPPISYPSNAQFALPQFLSGHVIECGSLGSAQGVFIDSAFTPMPPTPGQTCEAKFMAGNIVYGVTEGPNGYTPNGGFAWNMSTSSVTFLPGAVPICVSPSGRKIALYKNYLASVVDVPSGAVTTPKLAKDQTSIIVAVSDAGNGIGYMQTNPNGAVPPTADPLGIASFAADGTVTPFPMNGATAYPLVYSFFAVNADGTVAGQLTSNKTYDWAIGVWKPGNPNPTVLARPGATETWGFTMNAGGAIAGEYNVSGIYDSKAVVWPQGTQSPARYVDLNFQFPQAKGARIYAMYAFDPTSLKFIAGVILPNGNWYYQPFRLN